MECKLEAIIIIMNIQIYHIPIRIQMMCAYCLKMDLISGFLNPHPSAPPWPLHLLSLDLKKSEFSSISYRFQIKDDNRSRIENLELNHKPEFIFAPPFTHTFLPLPQPYKSPLPLVLNHVNKKIRFL